MTPQYAQPAPPYAPSPPAPPGPRLVDPRASSGERTYALLTHLSAAGYLLIGVPVVIGLVMWLVKRGASPFIDDHGREAVNFQISLLLYSVGVLAVAVITCGVGALLAIPLYALGIIGCILAAIAANRGEFYRYPMCIRLLT